MRVTRLNLGLLLAFMDGKLIKNCVSQNRHCHEEVLIKRVAWIVRLKFSCCPRCIKDKFRDIVTKKGNVFFIS